MIGYLQYCATGNGTYLNLGSVIPFKDRFLKVEPIKIDDFDGYPETVGYQVTCRALAIEISSNFLTESKWNFRIYFPNDNKQIKLFERNYHLVYDAKLNTNLYKYSYVLLDFITPYDKRDKYIIPSDIPLIPTSDMFIEGNELIITTNGGSQGGTSQNTGEYIEGI